MVSARGDCVKLWLLLRHSISPIVVVNSVCTELNKAMVYNAGGESRSQQRIVRSERAILPNNT